MGSFHFNGDPNQVNMLNFKYCERQTGLLIKLQHSGRDLKGRKNMYTGSWTRPLISWAREVTTQGGGS